jgi:hypothetical protein
MANNGFDPADQSSKVNKSQTTKFDALIDKKIAELTPNFVTPEQIAEAKERAQNALEGKSNEITPEMLEKMKGAADIIWRSGLPGTIEYMKYLVISSECPKKEFKEKCIKQIGKLENSLGDTDGLVATCMEFKFNGKSARAYIRLCDKDHDLTGQLIKLSTLFGEKYSDHESRLMKSLGEIVFNVRKVWTQVVYTNQKLAVKIQNIMANQYSENIRGGLKVDPTNTTLYIDPTLSKRLGIFIDVDS